MKILSGFYLKVIALITMVVDHIGVVFYPDCNWLRVIGRIAFPIFAFLLVEGYFHTSDVKKYIMRMATLAFISEIPFDLIVYGNVVDFRHQNIFFTFVIGLFMMYMMSRCVQPIYSTLWLVLGFVIATVFMADYSYYGIAIIYLFYRFRNMRLFGCIGLVVASILFGNVQIWAILAIPLLLMYNGKKGPAFADKKVYKYSFYGFYPLHMIILFGIKVIFGL